MQLGEVIRKWRLMSELDLRTAATQIGIDHTALFRLEQGRTPSTGVMLAVWVWLTQGGNNGSR